MDPHSFFLDPDPVVLLNADPAAFELRIRIQLNKICNILTYKELIKTKIARQSLFTSFFHKSFLRDPDPQFCLRE